MVNESRATPPARRGGVQPKALGQRLSLYLRQLDGWAIAGLATVSSGRIAAALGVNDAQVRKDLSRLGVQGHPGIGYDLAALRAAVRGGMGLDRQWRTALVGVGNLGRALLGYRGFATRGFEVAALFDADPAIHGQRVAKRTVRPMEELPAARVREGLELAILAVPAAAAQEAAAAVAAAGFVGILNFAPVPLTLPAGVSLVAVDLGLQLEQLAFMAHQRHPPREAV